MTFTRDQILQLYQAEAEKHGLRGTSTIQDIRTRILEIEALSSYVRDGDRILEVGCGNGYTAEQLVQRFAVEIDAIDFSNEMVAIARARKIAGGPGRVSFDVNDVLTLDAQDRYDLTFTERALQNLPTWEEQKVALHNVARALKRGGRFVMLEGFRKGHEQLNAARAELGLPQIPFPWHNLFFDEEAVKAHLESLSCGYTNENCFLSGYYFGSRVIYPALLPAGREAAASSLLNDYFWRLPAHGDFCPMKILVFEKR